MKHPVRLRIAASSLGLLLAACGDDAGESAEISTTEDASSSSSSTTSTSSGDDGTSTTAPDPSSSSEGSADSTSTTDASTEGSESTETGTTCLEEDVELPGEAFYPEGVAAHGEILFVGSAVTGEIVRADTCAGTVEPFVRGGILPGAIGLRVDAARNLLWACAFDSTQEVFSSLNAFDLDSGEHLAAHSFASPGFCNDVVLDDTGNVYATDSYGHRILRVASDDALDDTAVETWLADPLFVVPPGEIGLNGISWEAGLLRTVTTIDGRLLEVSIEDDGSAGAVTVTGEAGTLAGPDGMIPHEGGLLMVEGVATRLSHVDTDDLTVTPLAEGFDFPTTVAVIGDTAWVAEAQFDHLFGLDKAPPTLPFRVRRVPLR